MKTPTLLLAGVVAAVTINMAIAPQALAEPLTPPAPGEEQYLQQLRKVFAASHDPTSFRSDGELLSLGRFACNRRDAGFVGQEATLLTPAITQLAFIYLCP